MRKLITATLVAGLVLIATPAQAGVSDFTIRQGQQTFDRWCRESTNPNPSCSFSVVSGDDLKVTTNHARANLIYRVTRPHATLSRLIDVNVYVYTGAKCAEANTFVQVDEPTANYVQVTVSIGNLSGAPTSCTVDRVRAEWSAVF